MRKWEEVEKDIFTADDEPEVLLAQEQLRAQVRAYQLAEIRRTRHITQREVAEIIGVSAARISQIEHGQVDRAAIRGLAEYVQALGGRLELVADFGDQRIRIG